MSPKRTECKAAEAEKRCRVCEIKLLCCHEQTVIRLVWGSLRRIPMHSEDKRHANGRKLYQYIIHFKMPDSVSTAYQLINFADIRNSGLAMSNTIIVSGDCVNNVMRTAFEYARTSSFI